MGKRTLSVILTLSVIFTVAVILLDKGDKNEAAQKETSCLDTQISISEDKKESYTALNYSTVKAMWISQFDMTEIYTEGGAQRDEEDYTERVDKIIKNLTSLGVNTVFFQLRPNADSLYPSKIFPASKYAVGKYGRELGYDPFQIFLDLAHSADISVHAWINPLRCMRQDDITLISDEYKVKRWYYGKRGSYIVAVNGVFYLNPAYSEVRGLIYQGVSEIIEKYNVDGIHIDDYFYPTTDPSFDASAYAEYAKNKETVSLSNFRREQINELVRGIYSTVKNYNHTILFGVSPGGNNDRNYNELYANVYEWCASDNYIDYICPQIYFGFEHETHPFDKICDEFYNMIKSDNIKLIIGITLEKAYNGYNGISDTWAGSGADEWIEERDIIKRSLEYAKETEAIGGISFFSYRLFFDPLTSLPIIETAEEIEAALPIFKNFRGA